MLRVALIALAFVFMPGCAHAQEGRIDRSETPAVRAIAHALIQSLPESRYRDWGYGWGPVSSRVSGLVHWHIFEPDPRDRPVDAIVRRNGWLDQEGASVGVSVFGNDETVTMLSFTYSNYTNLDVLDALRDVGADVSFQADYESYSEYIVTPPERAPGLLVLSRQCTSARSAAAQRCTNSAEMKFELE